MAWRLWIIYKGASMKKNESGFSNEVKWTAEDTTAPASPQTLTVTVKQQQQRSYGDFKPKIFSE